MCAVFEREGKQAEADAASRAVALTGRTVRTGHPRLLWWEGDEERIRGPQRTEAESDVVRAVDGLLLEQAEAMVGLPPLLRILEGPRLLTVARQALKRSTTLAYAWRMTGERRFVEALEALLRTVCRFPDWNPPHFLDTAEMALGVALGLDWAHEALSVETRELAERTLITHAILPSLHPSLAAQLPLASNWNPVCHAGVLAAVLVLDQPKEEWRQALLARAEKLLPAYLATFAPEGVPPEGLSYWSYGAGFHALLVSMLETALGSDGGLGDFPAFRASADAVLQLTGPSGDYANFGDCGPRPLIDETRWWFALRDGSRRHLQADRVAALAAHPPSPEGAENRLLAPGLLWAVRFAEREAADADDAPLPNTFHGRGSLPVAVWRSAQDDSEALFVALKGGAPAHAHSHLDAGSFVLEVGGVRWSVDPFQSDYNALESALAATGGNLWDPSPASQRWNLLSRNNFGHSTLSVNAQLHATEAAAPVSAFAGIQPTATVDLSAVLAPHVTRALRTFTVPDARTIETLDTITPGPAGGSVQWQLLTCAAVEVIAPDRLQCRQNGRVLEISILEASVEATFTVVPLDPPPPPDVTIFDELKRIEIKMGFASAPVTLRVRMLLTSPSQ